MPDRSSPASLSGPSSLSSSGDPHFPPQAANDDEAGSWPASLTEALRLFASYGAAARNMARLACWQAASRNDAEAQAYWQAVCWHFDAAALARGGAQPLPVNDGHSAEG